MADPKVIVALDYETPEQAMTLVRRISAEQCKLKVGKELFTVAGPDLVRELIDLGFDVFLDLKYHDIPNTVEKACKAAAGLGVWMLNVHALGGHEMMIAARQGVADSGHDSLLIAVTVLTSMDQQQLDGIGISQSIPDLVVRLAGSAVDCGLHGVVCSARETTLLREKLGETPVLVTPGIRPSGSQSDDQKRIVTPEQAVSDGSSYLVIGRPITRHPDPALALTEINSTLS